MGRRSWLKAISHAFVSVKLEDLFCQKAGRRSRKFAKRIGFVFLIIRILGTIIAIVNYLRDHKKETAHALHIFVFWFDAVYFVFWAIEVASQLYYPFRFIKGMSVIIGFYAEIAEYSLLLQTENLPVV